MALDAARPAETGREVWGYSGGDALLALAAAGVSAINGAAAQAECRQKPEGGRQRLQTIDGAAATCPARQMPRSAARAREWVGIRPDGFGQRRSAPCHVAGQDEAAAIPAGWQRHARCGKVRSSVWSARRRPLGRAIGERRIGRAPPALAPRLALPAARPPHRLPIFTGQS